MLNPRTRKQALSSVYIFLVIVVFGSYISAQTTYEEVQGAKKNCSVTFANLPQDLPKGDWSVSFHPYLGEDFLDAPVIVQSVSSKQLSVEKFEIRNISNKPVKAIKVRWIVYENQNRRNILMQGESKTLHFRRELAEGEAGFIRLKIISFFDFYHRFVVEGQLNKHLNVDLVISEVIFADDSFWKRDDRKFPDLNQELRAKLWSKMLESAGDCAKQRCVPRPSETVRGGVVYSCASSDYNERCVVSGNFECTNQSCFSSGDSGSEIEVTEV